MYLRATATHGDSGSPVLLAGKFAGALSGTSGSELLVAMGHNALPPPGRPQQVDPSASVHKMLEGLKCKEATTCN